MMSALTQITSEVEKRCRPGGLTALFLDYDGTLVPIAADPATPQLDPQTRNTLSLIAGKQSFATTIISGRAVEDLFTRIRIGGLIYAGNHGLEIFGRNLCFVEPTAAALREKLAHLSEDLARMLQAIPGAFVEYKGLTTSVHYRQVLDAQVATVQDTVHSAVAASGSFRANTGRKVVEIVPRTNWNKGAAARWITRRLGRDEHDIVAIYFGDDATDEHAFSALTDAITVKVGGCQASSARYHVPGPEAVHEFLQWLAGRASSASAAR
jgi:trehalose 6-phosphate phosphatase